MTTLRTYRNMLPTLKHRLDDELEIYATIYDNINEQTVIHNSRAQQAKDELARIEDQLAEDFRDQYEKITKDAVEAKVRAHSRRMDAWRAHQKARAEYEEWAGLLEAWKQKGYAIKSMAALFSANYFHVTTTSTGHRAPIDEDRQSSGHPSRFSREDTRQASEDRAALRKASNQARPRAEDSPAPPASPRRRTMIDD